MRTAIYVYELADVRINAPKGLVLVGMNVTAPSLRESGPITLSPGIYKIVSSAPVKVDARIDLVTVEVTTNDKDPWPRVPPLKGLVGSCLSDVQSFFMVEGAKDLPSLRRPDRDGTAR